ncbi:MAG: hypothetical protein OWV35_05310 [Firmicutes bacterium]|nr:hypothetical protein [Bacillota bacterium]
MALLAAALWVAVLLDAPWPARLTVAVLPLGTVLRSRARARRRLPAPPAEVCLVTRSRNPNRTPVGD